MLQVNNLSIFYDDLKVVDKINFTVNKGEIVAIIGANGAGKTSTLRAISRLISKTTGEIFFKDIPLHKLKPHQILSTGITHIPEARRLFVNMTVEENLFIGALFGEAKKRRKETLEYVYHLFPKLKMRRKQLAGTLSGGEQQMVAIGRGLMSLPELMILDEPSLGLAPILVQEIFKTLVKLKEEGKTILLVEQNVNQSLQIADRGYVLELGKIVLEDKGKNLLNNSYIKKAYLGI